MLSTKFHHFSLLVDGIRAFTQADQSDEFLPHSITCKQAFVQAGPSQLLFLTPLRKLLFMQAGQSLCNQANHSYCFSVHHARVLLKRHHLLKSPVSSKTWSIRYTEGQFACPIPLS